MRRVNMEVPKKKGAGNGPHPFSFFTTTTQFWFQSTSGDLNGKILHYHYPFWKNMLKFLPSKENQWVLYGGLGWDYARTALIGNKATNRSLLCFLPINRRLGCDVFD